MKNMLSEVWIQDVIVGVITVAAVVYLIVGAVKRRRQNACPYCPANRQADN